MQRYYSNSIWNGLRRSSSWTDEETFAWLRKLARSKFDEDCVDALLFNVKKTKEIQAQFRET